MELIAWMLLIVPVGDAPVYHCDQIEVNHVFAADTGCVHLEQLIFRCVAPDEIRDWRMLAKTGLPKRDFQSNYWIVRWVEDGTLVEVRAREVVETWSDHDREILEREWLPQEARRRINWRKEGINHE